MRRDRGTGEKRKGLGYIPGIPKRSRGEEHDSEAWWDHILETGDRSLKDRLWAEVRKEHTETMKTNSEQCGNTDYRSGESWEHGESARVQKRKPRGTESSR